MRRKKKHEADGEAPEPNKSTKIDQILSGVIHSFRALVSTASRQNLVGKTSLRNLSTYRVLQSDSDMANLATDGPIELQKVRRRD